MVKEAWKIYSTEQTCFRLQICLTSQCQTATRSSIPDIQAHLTWASPHRAHITKGAPNPRNWLTKRVALTHCDQTCNCEELAPDQFSSPLHQDSKETESFQTRIRIEIEASNLTSTATSFPLLQRQCLRHTAHSWSPLCDPPELSLLDQVTVIEADPPHCAWHCKKVGFTIYF
jgi:hypothetical protein